MYNGQCTFKVYGTPLRFKWKLLALIIRYIAKGDSAAIDPQRIKAAIKMVAVKTFILYKLEKTKLQEKVKTV